MARRRRRRDRGEREASDFSNRSRLFELERELDRPAALVIRSSPSSFNDWSTVDDRRQWHPDGDDRPAVDFDAVPVRIVERPTRTRVRQSDARHFVHLTSYPSQKVVRRNVTSTKGLTSGSLYGSRAREVFGFETPGHVVVCARRKERREVLFAKGRTGRGSRGPRTRNWRSEITC